MVVVDNCPERTGKPTVDEVASDGVLRFVYESEPTPGVSAARNRGVARARGELIAFLDDDEEAEPGWLAELVAAQQASGADAVFGAVVGRFDGPRDRVELHEKEMSRMFPERAGPVPLWRIASLGSGNSLFRRRCFEGAQPFDVSLGLSGGEDTALIHKLRAEGRQLSWCPDARVKEFFTQERLTMAYLLKRRFSAGQVRSSVHAMAGKGKALVAMWMLIGVVQVSVGGALAVATLVVKPEASQRALCVASGGLGKLLWMSPFRLRRYQDPKKKQQP